MVNRARWQREQELLALFMDDRMAFRSEYRRLQRIAEPQPLPDETDWERLLKMLDAEFQDTPIVRFPFANSAAAAETCCMNDGAP